MMNLSGIRLFPPVDCSDPAMARAGMSIVAEDKRARPEDDLLRCLPVDRKSSKATGPLAVATLEINSARMDLVSRVAASLGTDCERFFMIAFATLLARLAGQERVKLRDILGDRMILTFHFDDEVSFRSLLAATPSQSLSADQPCAVEYVFSARELSYPSFPPDGLRLAVHLLDGDGQDGCQIQLVSSTSLWGRSLLQLWLRYFDRLLAAVADEPDSPWKLLPLLDPAEAEEFYLALNHTEVVRPDNACVHDIVIRQAERTPDAIAIVSESQSLTYRQLHDRSHAIARRLQALGAGPDRPVAISLERSVQLPVALLGILKSGSCYIPLDQQDSPQRLASILEESRPAAMIVDRSFPQLLGTDAIPLIFADDIADSPSVLELAPSGVTTDHQAYIIYTSGTTGKPKGVMITHRSLANLLESIMHAPGFSSADRMLAVSPISFDIATMDMFLPLVAGGTLVVADRLAGADPSRLAGLLEKFGITVLQATPATWRLLASADWQGKRDLKMISGGEALPRDLANRLLSLGGELWNCYGPTETTIYSGVLQIHSELDLVPIGPPIANTKFYVLDDIGRLLPPGVPGELYIGGIGVSSGYVDPSQDLRHAFSRDPYTQMPGTRMFKSGDLVRLINGNEFEFFGRRDHQVKLRGYRIELGEIESALRTFDGVENAVAARRENDSGEPYLIAYCAAANEQFDLRQLRDHVSRLLPAYMVPSRFVLLDEMPLTVSGKIDRRTLLASASSGLSAYHQPDGVEPQTPLEAKLLIIFRDVLSAADFGITDNFFDYGGYSLLTVKLFDRVNRTLNLSLPISLLFDAPTVKALAEMIDLARPVSLVVPIRPRGGMAPLFVIHSYLLYGVLPHVVEPNRPVYGLREVTDDQGQTIQDRAAIYVKEILKVYPQGPLLLTGWCAAGSMTVEIARQLREIGHPVGLVALLDAEQPAYRPLVRGKRLARLRARMKFHFRRLRAGSTRQKIEYVRNALQHGWETMLESLFTRHRPLLMSLQRVLGFSVPQALFKNTWARAGALQNYVPARYPGRVILFRATDVPQLPESDETLGWKEIADDGVEVVFVPGDHESMFRKPHVESFSRRLCQVLQLAEYDRSPGVSFARRSGPE
jgi:amino acid adenylation domain-containing protein